MKKVSNSFVYGAIALVFSVLGYQTALVVNYSAAARIVAARDCPDTVYAVAAGSQSSGEAGSGMSDRYIPGRVRQHSSGGGDSPSGRKLSDRQDRIRRNMRENLPPARVESFRFNPNTATVETFVRLGFTPAQAEGIVAYREKCGGFRRKEDFAGSYSVPDSIYRRLEKFVDIPKLDLNLADSADFDALPGIGGYFSHRMVEFRERLGGYSYPEQLMDIRNFDRERYSGIEDLITVSHPAEYPLWTICADSLRLHPYIRNPSTARSIVFFRENNPRSEWTVQNLVKAGILTPEQGERMEKCAEML